MKKSLNKLSAGIVLAVLLSFAPFAFGQSPAHSNAVAGLHAMPGFLTFVFDGGRGNPWGNGGNGGNNGCSQGKGGNNGWGWGWWGQGGNNGGGNCQTVPEGGTGLMYILLAGVVCFGAITLRSRRKVGAQEVKAAQINS
jgi:hypothetical protein